MSGYLLYLKGKAVGLMFTCDSEGCIARLSCPWATDTLKTLGDAGWRMGGNYLVRNHWCKAHPSELGSRSADEEAAFRKAEHRTPKRSPKAAAS